MRLKSIIPMWQRLNRKLAAQKPVARLASRSMHHIDPLVYRLSGERWTAASLLVGLPVVQLTTIGARSGRTRTVPLLALVRGDDLVLLASNWGGNRQPGWYHNLRRNPAAMVAHDGQTRAYMAREAEGAERENLWREAVAMYAGYEAYRERTGGRAIPIMVLSPQTG